MAVPSPEKRAKQIDTRDKLLEKFGNAKLSEKQILSILRSSVRESWMQSPVRLAKIEQAVIHDMNPDTRTLWLIECECCKRRFKKGDIEVDHINGEHQLLTMADIEKFARSVLDVTLDDLQILCKPCHEIKTYAERYDMTFEEARIEKEVIFLMKSAKKVSAQKAFLSKHGIDSSGMTNEDARRESYRSLFKRGVLTVTNFA